MLLYAITNRRLCGANEAERAGRLIELAAEWAAGGVDFLQIRERDLGQEALIAMATTIVAAVRNAGSSTRVLINHSSAGAVSIVRQAGADGLHLPSGATAEQLARAIGEIRRDLPVASIGVSCHSAAEVEAARAARATLALFAPVFEKVLPDGRVLPGSGLDALARACEAGGHPGPLPSLPVLALGGVTLENAAPCVAWGAAGIAAIRLFLHDGRHGGQSWRKLAPRQPVP